MTDFWDKTTVAPNDRLENAGMLNYIKTISVFSKKRKINLYVTVESLWRDAYYFQSTLS